MSPAGGAPGGDAEATGAGATGAAEIMLAFDQATVDLDALQRSAYAVAAEMTVDIRVCDAAYVCTLFPRTRDIAADERGTCYVSAAPAAGGHNVAEPHGRQHRRVACCRAARQPGGRGKR